MQDDTLIIFCVFLLSFNDFMLEVLKPRRFMRSLFYLNVPQ